jgi:hypothetical protein
VSLRVPTYLATVGKSKVGWWMAVLVVFWRRKAVRTLWVVGKAVGASWYGMLAGRKEKKRNLWKA